MVMANAYMFMANVYMFMTVSITCTVTGQEVIILIWKIELHSFIVSYYVFNIYIIIAPKWGQYERVEVYITFLS